MNDDPDDFKLEDLGDRRFFDFVSMEGLARDGALSGAPGEPAPNADQSPMVRRFEQAWHTRYRELTCEQVRLLLGQKAGIERLAGPILEFVSRYPTAHITNYPGEMALLAMRAADAFLVHAPVAFRQWLEGDFAWMDEAFCFSRSLRREADEALSAARAIAAPADTRSRR